MTEQLTEEQLDKIFDEELKRISGIKPEEGTKPEEEQSKELTEVAKPEEPSGEAKQEVTQPVEEIQPETKTEEPKDDPQAFLESLAPEIKDRVLGILKEKDELAQRDFRLRGQISAIDRKLQQERQARNELERKLLSQTPPSEELPPEIKELAEVDPALAKAFEANNKLLKSQLARETDEKFKLTERTNAEFEEARRQRELIEQVEQLVPNWQQIVLDVDDKGQVKVDRDGNPQFNPYWQDFLSTLPERAREVAIAPKSLEDAKFSFDLYGKWASQFYQETDKQQDHAQADAIQRKRELDKKKTTVKTVVSPAPASQEIDWSDEKNQDLMFNEALKKLNTGTSKYYK